MLPIFDPGVAMFAPILRGVLELAAVAVGGMVVVVALVARAQLRPPRPRASVSRIRPHFHEAA